MQNHKPCPSRRRLALPTSRAGWALGAVLALGGACHNNETTMVPDFMPVPVDGGVTPVNPVTAPAPTALTATVEGGVVKLSWKNPSWPAGLTFGGVRIIRLLGGAPKGPSDNTATLVYAGPAESASDPLPGLLPSTTLVQRPYYYAAYACDDKTGASTSCEATGTGANTKITVTQALGAGGYTLWWRHAAADVCNDNLALGTAANTTSPNWWKSCESNCAVATARQLNDTGRAQAATIGQDMKARGIKIGKVLSSEYCRTLQTAQGMNFGPPIEENKALTYYVYDENNRCRDTKLLMNIPPAAGTNTAHISHAGNSCSPLSDLAWGEAAIYKPSTQGEAVYIDRVSSDMWKTLP